MGYNRSRFFQDNANPVGGGLGPAAAAAVMNEWEAGHEDASNRLDTLETAGAGTSARLGTLEGNAQGTSDRVSTLETSGPVDPRNYGAVAGAGVSDAQATTNAAAINAALAVGIGVRFPPLEFHIRGALTVTGSGFQVFGAGRGKTKITQRDGNTGIFVVTGSRLRIEGMSLTWAFTQTATDTASAAVDVVSKGSGGILSNSVIRELDITQCAIGIDLRDSIGYSCSFDNIMVESFAISALACDAGTAWTQSSFGVWHIANQPLPYYTGAAIGGGTTTIQLPSTASAVEAYYVGMTLTLTGGSGSSGAVRFITAYDSATKTATFYPAAAVAVDSTTTFSVARQATCSDVPFKLTGFTDVHIKELAFEFVTLPSAVPAPMVFESCAAVVVDLIRGERVVWRAANSALWQANGRCATTIRATAFQYCAALVALGVANFYLSRTFNQATVAVTGTIENDGWQVTAQPRWALVSASSSAGRNERPHGGTYFKAKLSGDTNLSPVGQATDFLGPQRQTAILDRPPAEARGASLDEGNVATYTHSLMDRPDVIRFNTPITQDVTVVLDVTNLVAGAPVTVVRGAGCTGAFNILVRASSTTVAALATAGTTARVYCDGVTYQIIP